MKRLGLLTLLILASMQLSAETICAIVKIEIRQELSFERQAFDAQMIIRNGLDVVSLENLNIDVNFADIDGNPVLASNDPNNTNAKFFIRIDTIDGVNDVDGSGVIAAGQVAEIHWLIIPAPGTGGLTPTGLRYAVGATVSYNYGEESQTVNVVPDFITVSPTPLLKLDYFLPTDVFGDDSLTTAIEAVEPFDLGLRISNTGAGFANDLKIESAQPVITENDQGLLIDFEILSTSVNDQNVTNSLLADIGRLDAGDSAMVSWLMQSSLNGEFVSFEADFAHSDELGGQLTSLIDAPIDTHILLHKVKVDFSGRDQVTDFLAYDEDVLRVYESNGGQALVIDESNSINVTDLGVVEGKQKYQVNFNTIVGAGFARWSDPFIGDKRPLTAFRSDGKLLPADNIWQYKKETDPGMFEYYIGLFDVNSTGQYEIFADEGARNNAPVITVVSPQNGVAGTQMLFEIDVADVDAGDILTLVSIGAPITSSVSSVSGSTWQFSWFPQAVDVGTQNFILLASDGTDETSLEMELIITAAPFIDTDNDGMADDWEQLHFGSLDENGTGDFDQDSASNLQEYSFGGNPILEDRPGVPQILMSNNRSNNRAVSSNFTVINSNSAINADIVYEFELYEKQVSQTPVASANVNETSVQTTWVSGFSLVENMDYIWRVRAHDGATPSNWSYDNLKVDEVNDAPANCLIDYPNNSQLVSSNQPILSVIAANDSDSDVLLYRYQIYSDAGLTNELANSGWLVASDISSDNALTMQWQPYITLDDSITYYWSVNVKDELSIISCGNATFTVDSASTQAEAYSIIAPQSGAIDDINIDLLVSHDSNANNAINYNYFIELDTQPTFSSVQLQQSGVIVANINNQVQWPLANLQFDTLYYWRVKAHNGSQDGVWIYSQFRTRQETAQPIVEALNPAHNSWISSVSPELQFQLDWRVNNLDHYLVEIYADDLATNLLFSQTVDNENWVVPMLVDRQYYYWRAQVQLTDATVSDFTPLQQFFIIDDLVNDTPVFEFKSLNENEENTSDTYNIQWSDADKDSNANIDLYYDNDATGVDGTLIVSAIDEDDSADNFNWDISAIDNGQYYLYAIIDDGQASSTVYSNNALIIEHHMIDVQSNGIVTSENGGTVIVTVSLNKKPKDFVIIPLSISDTTEAIIDKDHLLFTPDNWAISQQITVTGIDDSISDGNQNYTLQFASIITNDQSYASIILDPISLVNIEGGSSGSIGDFIWSDSNRDGLHNIGEPGISNVTIYLCAENTDPCDTNSAITTTTTDATGHYLFSNVDLNVAHIVAVDTMTLPNAHAQTGDPDGVGSLDNQTTVMALNTSNNIYLLADFGYFSSNTIEGTVWSDNDDNGLLTDGTDGSPDETGNGIQEVTIEIIGTNGTLITTTNASGFFSFSDLSDGTYTVVVTDDNDKLNTTKFTPTDGPNANDNNIDNNSQDETGYVVTIAGGIINSTADFGYRPVVSTPITLASFKAEHNQNSGVTQIKWSTMTETGNIGFELYRIVDGNWQLVNNKIIPSKHVYNTGLTQYEYSYEGGYYQEWALVDLDIKGNRQSHGVYQVNQLYGVDSRQERPVPWINIQQLHNEKAEAQKIQKIQDINSFIRRNKNKVNVTKGGES